MKHLFAFLLIFAMGFGSIAPALAQEAAPAPAPAAPAAAATPTEVTQEQQKDHSKSLWEHIKEGGPVMILIAICSIATLYLIVDGLMRYTNFKKNVPKEHVDALKSLFRSGDYQGAYKFCKNNPSGLTNVCRAALSMVGEGKIATEEATFAEISKENARMQYFISYLSVIGVCTPMIGLLGTVFGMISAFATLGTSGIGDPSKLSAAIGEVLVATASGLLIAIPAFFSFYWLRNRAAKLVHLIQETMATLFRKMPYEHLAGAHLGDEELYAATPNWVQTSPAYPEPV
jgi:biopolymer transport protein ExbB